MEQPFSMQMVSLSRRTARLLPQKFRNFRVWLSAVEFQITDVYKRQRHPRPQLNAWYNWPDKTLYDILTRKEYLGHTITGKTYTVSYKSKKTKKNPEEKRYFFPNTHEPLIDEETFELRCV